MELPGSKRSAIAFPVFLVGVLALGWLGLRGWQWWDDRERAARDAKIAILEREGAGLTKKLAPRLAELEAVATGHREAPTTCPEVPGPVSLVQAKVLSVLAAGRSNLPVELGPYSSPAFQYLSSYKIPARDTPATFATRNESYRSLLAARFAVVLVDAAVESATKEGEHGFRGGSARGRAVVVDLEQRRVVCAAPVASQALVALSVDQHDDEMNRRAAAHSLTASAAQSFWTEAEAALGVELETPQLF